MVPGAAATPAGPPAHPPWRGGALSASNVGEAEALSPRRQRAAWLIGCLFVLAGLLHFVRPDGYARIVPHVLPAPRVLVWVSGACEILGGVGLLLAPVRRPAGLGLIALLVAVFPANVQMLVDARAHGAPGWQEAVLWLRLPLQALFIWWVWRAAVRRIQPGF